MMMMMMVMVMVIVTMLMMMMITRCRQGTPEFSCCCRWLLCWWTSLVDHLVLINDDFDDYNNIL